MLSIQQIWIFHNWNCLRQVLNQSQILAFLRGAFTFILMSHRNSCYLPFLINKEIPKGKGMHEITENGNFQIWILEWVWEQMNQNNHYNSKTQKDKTVEQRNRERFYRLYFRLRNIVKINWYNKPMEEIEKLTREILEDLVLFILKILGFIFE